MKSVAASEELYFYIINFQCKRWALFVNEFADVSWNRNFLLAVNRLPQSFSSSDEDLDFKMENYQYFWQSYGTHFIKGIIYLCFYILIMYFKTINIFCKDATLGGSIFGAISSSKCGVETNFNSQQEYDACINTEYKSTDKNGNFNVCTDRKKNYTTKETASQYLTNKQISLKGGDMQTFLAIINDFTRGNQKALLFDDWVQRINTTPAIISATIYSWQFVIRNSAKQKHNFNQYGDELENLNDDVILNNIGIALGNAYEYYSDNLLADDNKTHCTYSCGSSPILGQSCPCSECVRNKML